MDHFNTKANVTSADRTQLKSLNVAFTTCISENFLPKFLAGEAVNINDFCVDERTKMLDLDKQVYNEQFWMNDLTRDLFLIVCYERII